MAIQKKSRKRDAILACVCSTDTHPTAEWVYTQLKPDIPDLSLGTVYRNLAATPFPTRILCARSAAPSMTCRTSSRRSS